MKFQKGEISAVELKAHRVPFGIYEQRKHDTYMVRVRCAGGIVTPSQLERISELSKEYGFNSLHITTRQEIQMHDVKLENLIIILKELYKIGLSTRGGGGNTVRNILAEEESGVDKDEVFDTSPYAVSLTERLLSENDSLTLPRKFKVAFSGSGEDKGFATVNDVGFIAVQKNGSRGFRVYTAGGLGAKSSEAKLLFNFIDTGEVYNIAKAVKNIFWKYGNRKNKHAARLRFLWDSLGEEGFKKTFFEEYNNVKKENYNPLAIAEIENSLPKINLKKENVKNKDDFDIWKKRFVREQKQAGLFLVLIPIELGFIENEKVKKLAQFLKLFQENIIRLTKDQNILLRNIPQEYLPNVYNFLNSLGIEFNKPGIIGKIISCAGSSTCQLGICKSRALAKEIISRLKEGSLDLDKLPGIRINISGCPNSCGQHPLADLGFFGKVSRKDERLYPAYNIVGGAVIHDGKTQLAEYISEINARDLPDFLLEFLGLYLSKVSNYETFNDYLKSEGKKDLIGIADKYKNIPSFNEDKNYYCDWGDQELFSLAERGAGECSAGFFDLIEVDLKNINSVQKEISVANESDKIKIRKLLWDLAFYSSRMLLITKGIEPKTEIDVFNDFKENFIKSGLVEEAVVNVVEAAKNKDYDFFLQNKDSVYKLAERIKYLYQNMDNMFRFNIQEEKIEETIDKTSKETTIISKDFRGVACPMNFVKTKMELSKLNQRDILEILLDDGEPIENVPGSVKSEGHKILEQEKIGDYWKVVIEKG